MINVVGLGYIGLPTALMLASHGTEASGPVSSPSNMFCKTADRCCFVASGMDVLCV